MSPIVRAMLRRPEIHHEAILLTLFIALAPGCRSDPTVTPSEPAHAGASEHHVSEPHSSEPAHAGAVEHHLPEPHVYADRLDDASRRKWQKPEEVVDLLDCPESGTVVDLGAGTGYFLPYLSKAVRPNGVVLALDPERSMVERMLERIEQQDLRNVRPEVIGKDDPDLEPRSVDRILIVNTWHHIGDRRSYAAKLARALRPGGNVLIVDYTMDSPRGPPLPMRLKVDTVRTELEAGGMTTEVLEESLPYQYAIVGRP